MRADASSLTPPLYHAVTRSLSLIDADEEIPLLAHIVAVICTEILIVSLMDTVTSLPDAGGFIFTGRVVGVDGEVNLICPFLLLDIFYIMYLFILIFFRYI
jgi:hypothetical protein